MPQPLLEPVRKESLKDSVVSQIETRILTGAFPPGKKLPTERELALRLGVGRSVVHEAIIELEFKGLVIQRPRHGVVVNDFRENGTLALLTPLFRSLEGPEGKRFLENLLDVRRLFAVGIAKEAAWHHTAEDLQALEEILRLEISTDPGNFHRLAKFDFDFHLRLARISKNIVYPLLLNSFRHLHLELSERFYRDESVLDTVRGFHRDLIEAIAGQDEKSAAEIMEELLEHGRIYLPLEEKKSGRPKRPGRR